MDISKKELSGVKEPSVWTEPFHVRSFEADATGHLGIQHLCNYLQEVSGNHARALGVSIERLMELKLTWMLSRLHVQLDRYPFFRENILIDTWPSGHTGLQATREFLIYTEEGEHLARGTSAWLMIDLTRRRPVRMPDFVDALVIPELPRAIPEAFKKLPAPEHQDASASFIVGYRDLDINKHANSVRFVSWALEAVPFAMRSGRILSGLEVQHRAEAKYDDKLETRIELKDEGNVIHHGVYALDTGRELAVLRSTWEKR